MTKGLLRSCNKRSSLYKKFIKTKSQADRQKYIKYRNMLKSVVQKAKSDYYLSRFKQAHGNIKQTWQLLNSLIKGRTTSNDIAYLTVNNIKISDSVGMANALNEYFVNIGGKLASQIVIPSASFSDYLKGDYPNSILYYPTNVHEVIRIVDASTLQTK